MKLPLTFQNLYPKNKIKSNSGYVTYIVLSSLGEQPYFCSCFNHWKKKTSTRFHGWNSKSNVKLEFLKELFMLDPTVVCNLCLNDVRISIYSWVAELPQTWLGHHRYKEKWCSNSNAHHRGKTCQFWANIDHNKPEETKLSRYHRLQEMPF